MRLAAAIVNKIHAERLMVTRGSTTTTARKAEGGKKGSAGGFSWKPSERKSRSRQRSDRAAATSVRARSARFFERPRDLVLAARVALCFLIVYMSRERSVLDAAPRQPIGFRGLAVMGLPCPGEQVVVRGV